MTFWALAEMVKAQAGILDSDGEDEARAKLRSAVGNLVADEAEARVLEQQLGPLVGLAVERELPGDSQKEAFAAWRRFFEAMAEQHPLVLVFEDLHWADDGLLDFVDHLVEWAGRLPILIVCTGRPELLERRPGWGGGKLNATTLSLSPLSDGDTARLFATLLGKPVLESEQQQILLSRAGGNPLYAEQFARLVAEGTDPAHANVPENVQGIIAARLDRVPPEEKSLLQGAAVLGKVFWRGGLVNGRTGEEVERLLHSLERKGFVQRARRTSVSDEPEYAFLHGLVRDVAYGQIPRADRAQKHRRAAEWIESLGRLDDHAEMLAHHYRSALELVRAAGIETPELEARVRAALRAAGDRAAALNAYAAAVTFYEDALALCPEDQPQQGADLLFRLGTALHRAADGRRFSTLDAAKEALLAVGDFDRAAETDALQAEGWWIQGRGARVIDFLQRAEELVRDRPSSPSKARVLSGIARFHLVGGRPEEAIRIGRTAIAIAEELGLDEVRANTLVTMGTARETRGDRGGGKDLEAALELADQFNFPQVWWRAVNNLSVTFSAIRGELEPATELLESGLRSAERLGDRTQMTWFRGNLAINAFWTGHFDESLRLAHLVLEEAQGMAHSRARRPTGARANPPGAG